ncbi:MAG: hypothetical protein ACXABO_10785 [Promethearchaeota archaeon]
MERPKPRKMESNKIKKEPKYALINSQRDIFLRKILPTILTGSIIWLISEIIFSNIFLGFEFNQIFLTLFISAIIIECMLFTFLYFTSRGNQVQLSLILFFLFCFLAGFLSLPIVMITEFLPQVHMFVSLSVGATLITCFIGIVLREKYFAKGYIVVHILLFLIGTILFEVIFIYVFQIHNFLLTVPVTLAYILIVALTIMFYGSKVVKKNEKDPWLIKFFKIESILLISLIIAIVIVVVVLIIIAISIAFDSSGLDFSGFSWGGSKSRKRKQRKYNQ